MNTLPELYHFFSELCSSPADLYTVKQLFTKQILLPEDTAFLEDLVARQLHEEEASLHTLEESKKLLSTLEDTTIEEVEEIVHMEQDLRDSAFTEAFAQRQHQQQEENSILINQIKNTLHKK